MLMDIIKEVSKQAKKIFVDSKGSHDWNHTLRVYNLCLRIGKKEKATMEILKLAAILHDIGRKYEDECSGRICHAEKGAVLAKNLLHKLKVAKEKIDKIIHCVETHRFRGKKIPISKEAKILFDADKLDSIGAIGIGRAFLFAGEIGAKLHNKKINKTTAYTKEDTAYREYMFKLRKVIKRMVTKEGKRIAKGRHAFMINFFNRFNQEVDGKL